MGVLVAMVVATLLATAVVGGYARSTLAAREAAGAVQAFHLAEAGAQFAAVQLARADSVQEGPVGPLPPDLAGLEVAVWYGADAQGRPDGQYKITSVHPSDRPRLRQAVRLRVRRLYDYAVITEGSVRSQTGSLLFPWSRVAADVHAGGHLAVGTGGLGGEVTVADARGRRPYVLESVADQRRCYRGAGGRLVCEQAPVRPVRYPVATDRYYEELIAQGPLEPFNPTGCREEVRGRRVVEGDLVIRPTLLCPWPRLSFGPGSVLVVQGRVTVGAGVLLGELAAGVLQVDGLLYVRGSGGLHAQGGAVVGTGTVASRGDIRLERLEVLDLQKLVGPPEDRRLPALVAVAGGGRAGSIRLAADHLALGGERYRDVFLYTAPGGDIEVTGGALVLNALAMSGNLLAGGDLLVDSSALLVASSSLSGPRVPPWERVPFLPPELAPEALVQVEEWWGGPAAAPP